MQSNYIKAKDKVLAEAETKRKADALRQARLEQEEDAEWDLIEKPTTGITSARRDGRDGKAKAPSNGVDGRAPTWDDRLNDAVNIADITLGRAWDCTAEAINYVERLFGPKV